MADVDINGRLNCLKVGEFRKMRLLMLMFYSMVRGTTIDVKAVNTNTHREFLRRFLLLYLKFWQNRRGLEQDVAK
jgi:hypothetical protein